MQRTAPNTHCWRPTLPLSFAAFSFSASPGDESPGRKAARCDRRKPPKHLIDKHLARVSLIRDAFHYVQYKDVRCRSHMQSLTHIRIRSASIAVMLVLFVAAATPPKEKSEPTIIPVADIDRASVRVRTSKGETGAQVSFLFRDKDAQEARRAFFTSRARQVRITDGVTVVTETKLSGIVEHEIKTRKKGGLILSFDTVEEANRVATALRPFLK